MQCYISLVTSTFACNEAHISYQQNNIYFIYRNSKTLLSISLSNTCPKYLFIYVFLYLFIFYFFIHPLQYKHIIFNVIPTDIRISLYYTRQSLIIHQPAKIRRQVGLVPKPISIPYSLKLISQHFL